MKTYQSKPVFVEAVQWDGSKESLEAIRAEFKINHNTISYNEDQTIKSWSIGQHSHKQEPVTPGTYFVKSDNGVLAAIDEATFEKQFEPVKANK